MKYLAALLAAALLLSGCVAPIHIDIPYQPTASASPVAGAAAATVSVTAKDGRATDKDSVALVPEWGVWGLLIARNDIPTTVGNAIEQQLAAQGFKIGQNHAVVMVEVTKFYCEYSAAPFSFSRTANGEVAFNVRILDSSNVTKLQSKSYLGVGKAHGVWADDVSYVRTAMTKALQVAVDAAVNDRELQAALFAAQ